MWETIIAEYSVFVLKALTMVLVILILAGGLLKSKKNHEKGEIELTDLAEKYEEQQDKLESDMIGAKAFKKLVKERRKAAEVESTSEEEAKAEAGGRLFVIEYDGDIQAEAVSALREEITAVMMLAQKGDEVLLKLESPGGVVHGYGLAASQLQRLREEGIPLTVAVDKVAASGGYMMACVANKIVAAPFSIIGSIGVVAEVPNFHRLLKKHDIDVDVMTAGEYKRTVTLLGENTEAGKQKFTEELQTTHELFKTFVTQNRPQLDIERIATGETWYGTQALTLQLVDEIATSDDLILKAIQTQDVYQIKYKEKKSVAQKFSIQLEAAIERLVTKLFNKQTKIM